ncbi:MAG: hypothetical protein QM647_15260 [Asticcacaulis sp.]|uniref:hypothetical protein n=1 Tax=Asticcacaulis sp. TaxID=1872648 RepID=UPI0039E23EA7
MLHTDIQASAYTPDAADYASAGTLITFDMRTQEGREGTRDMLAKLAGEPKRVFVGPRTEAGMAAEQMLANISSAIRKGVR